MLLSLTYLSKTFQSNWDESSFLKPSSSYIHVSITALVQVNDYTFKGSNSTIIFLLPFSVGINS